MCNHGASIKMKIVLFIKQLCGNKFDNFPHLRERVAASDLAENKYTSKVAELLNVFWLRFSDFADHSDNIVLSTNPFNCLE